jgi:hypothetical protein
MGYSARYHAASLAAIFLALAVGILIGVGFGSDIVNGTADSLEKSLHADIDDYREQVDDLQQQLGEQGQFSRLAAPALVDGRLQGRRIALVALGGLDDSIAADVRSSLQQSGGELKEVAVVREPPDAGAVADASRAGSDRPLPRGTAFDRATKRSGRLLVRGGGGFAGLRAALLTRYSGEPGRIDGVVVVRQRPPTGSAREERDTDQLESQLVGGMADNKVPVVGVETTDTADSSIEFFDANASASVDNVNQLPGKVALVYTLDCAEGNYGVKDSADSLLPDLLAQGSTRCR